MTTTQTPATQPTPAPINPGRGYAIASFILGLFPVLPIAGSIAAIVLGHLSRKDDKRAGLKGSALAAWGIGLGWATLALTVLLIILFVVAAAKTTSNLNNLPTNYPTTFPTSS